MIVAATNFSLQRPASPEDFWRRFRLLVEQARDRGAELVLFPEHFSLSWLLADGGSFHDRLFAAADLEPRFVEEARRASSEFRLGVVAGTVPHVESRTELRSRSWICLPGQDPVFQDQVHVPPREAEGWQARGGPPELRAFRHAGATCAVATGRDVEFPAYGAAIAEAEVDVLFVPSRSANVHAYWRTRHCAEARAVESPCFVVMSSVVEGDARYPEIAAHYGKACVLTPCEVGFPASGALAEASANVEDVLDARLELRALQELRKGGAVRNARDAAPVRVAPPESRNP
jgi:predicted amidohydrolase